jgi:hypothetical protein
MPPVFLILHGPMVSLAGIIEMNTSRENFIGSAALIIEDYCGISLPLEKVSEIIGDKMEDEWNEYEYDEVSPFMDTSPREEVMNIVAEYFLRRSWPTYADRVDMEEWFSSLHDAVNEKF